MNNIIILHQMLHKQHKTCTCTYIACTHAHFGIYTVPLTTVDHVYNKLSFEECFY